MAEQVSLAALIVALGVLVDNTIQISNNTQAFMDKGRPPEAAAVPGKSGPEAVIAPPVSSIRWEMLREGIEDYEYLYLLRELIAKRREGLSPEDVERYESLLEVPESITKDMTTFTTHPRPIYQRRQEIAEAIETLRNIGQ